MPGLLTDKYGIYVKKVLPRVLAMCEIKHEMGNWKDMQTQVLYKYLDCLPSAIFHIHSTGKGIL